MARDLRNILYNRRYRKWARIINSKTGNASLPYGGWNNLPRRKDAMPTRSLMTGSITGSGSPRMGMRRPRKRIK